MMRITQFLTLLLALCASTAMAQGTITDDNANFVRVASSFDATPDANFTGVSPTLTQDHVFEAGWAFRVAGDTREFFFPVPTTQSFIGDTSTITWADVAARGLFSAVETSRIVDLDGLGGPTPSGRVEMTLQVTNLSAVTPLSIDLFHMIDIDVQPTAGNDRAAVLSAAPDPTLLITDAGSNTGQYQGVGASAFLVRAFSATDVAGLLDNAVVDNFDNTTVPFGPGDFTGGMQWSALTVPAGGSTFVTVRFAINGPVILSELALTKTDSIDPAPSGGALSYQIDVANTGVSAAPNVVVTETLPAGVTFVATTGCAEDPAGVPTCTLGTVAPGSTASYGIDVIIDVGTLGLINNTAVVTSSASESNTVDNSDTESTLVVANEADLSISISDAPDPVAAGSPLIYTVTVNNAGPFAATGLEVTSVLPAAFTFASTTGCSNDPAGSPTCMLADLASGAQTSFTLSGTVNIGSTGALTYTASVDSDATDPVPANNTDSETTTILDPLSDLTLSKSNNVGGSTASDNIFTWTLVLDNANGDAGATFAIGELLLRDQLPNVDIVYDAVVVTTGGGTTGTVDCAIVNFDLECTAGTIVTIPIGGTVTVAVPAGPAAVATYANPRAGGVCSADPNDSVDEDDENNNACSDTVTTVEVSIFADGFESP